jgi:hypothetical protein
MRNKLPCTAQKLSQIQPEMIQSVVGAQVFQLGKEYQSANCVQILEADEDQILSEVTGPFGLYEQTIQLKGGSLLTKCTCTSNEQPFCRHCVAVLLGHWHPAEGHTADFSGNSVSTESEKSEALSTSPSSPLSVNLHHVTIFIDWLQQAIEALDRGQSPPNTPLLAPGDAMTWIRGIQNLHARWRMSEEKRLSAEAELLARDAQFEQLLKNSEVLPSAIKRGQATCEDLQDGMTNSQLILGRLSDLAKERDRLETELRSTAEGLQKKGSELNVLFSSLTEMTSRIQSPGEQPFQ